MDRSDVLADYRSDASEHIRIVARRRAHKGTKLTTDGLEPESVYHSTAIEVVENGRVVHTLPLKRPLSSFSQADTQRLLEEINALKDSHAPAAEVIGELHTLLG